MSKVRQKLPLITRRAAPSHMESVTAIRAWRRVPREKIRQTSWCSPRRPIYLCHLRPYRTFFSDKESRVESVITIRVT
jgi:hypothetical protein